MKKLLEKEVDRQDRIIQELRDENEWLRKRVKDAFQAGWVYACADVKRGHRNSMYVDGRFTSWLHHLSGPNLTKLSDLDHYSDRGESDE